jgi:hypothetical protein
MSGWPELFTSFRHSAAAPSSASFITPSSSDMPLYVFLLTPST